MKSYKFLAGTILVVLVMVIVTGNYSKSSTAVSDSANKKSESDTLINACVRISESYKNLTIYFLSGIHKLDHAGYKILSEALDQKMATITETGNVNELSITNHSEYLIFINSGDIVKGGKQDRTIGVDIIIPPYAKSIKLESYCVESDRWRQRGNEEVLHFSVSQQVLPSRKLKIAAQKEKNQSRVWGDIREQQNKLNENISSIKGYAVDVKSDQSASSLQLTLENHHLDSIRNDYKSHFEHLPANDNDIIGFAYAINGELYGADLYNSRALFIKMWPRLLNSVAVEAITDYKSDSLTFSVPDNIIDKLAEVYKGAKNSNEINPATKSITYENNEMIVFETIDMIHHDWLHKSFIIGDTTNLDSGYSTEFQRLNQRTRIISQPETENSENLQEE